MFLLLFLFIVSHSLNEQIMILPTIKPTRAGSEINKSIKFSMDAISTMCMCLYGKLMLLIGFLKLEMLPWCAILLDQDLSQHVVDTSARRRTAVDDLWDSLSTTRTWHHENCIFALCLPWWCINYRQVECMWKWQSTIWLHHGKEESMERNIFDGTKTISLSSL